MDGRFAHVGKDLQESEKIYRPSMTYFQDALRRLKKNKASMVSFWILVFIIVMAIIGPFLSKHNYQEQFYDFMYRMPDMEMIKNGFYFGTDDLGRDFFVRIWEGARISLIIAFAAVIIEGIIGVIYGGVAGYFGGKVDNVMMRILEVLMAIPEMIYIILLMVVIGPGLHTIIIAMGFSRWMPMAMIVRGEVMRLKEQEYVMASVALGANPAWVIGKHLIPNSMGQIIVRLTLDIPQAIFYEAFLSFIGIGVPAPLASWGRLAQEGYRQIQNMPYLLIVPAVFISLMMLAFNIFGDGLRDALDPKLRK